MAYTTLHPADMTPRMNAVPPESHQPLADLLHSVTVSIGYRYRDMFPFLDEQMSMWTETEVRHTNKRGSLATFTGRSTAVGSERLHRITVYGAHQAFTKLPPDQRAAKFVMAHLHEAAHLVALVLDVEDTAGPDHRQHTEAFAEIADVLGLHVLRRRNDPVGIYTTGLAARGIDRMGEVIELLAEGLPEARFPIDSDVVGPYRLMRRLLPGIPALELSTHVNLTCQCRHANERPVVLQVARSYRARVESCSACGSRFLDQHHLVAHDLGEHVLKAG